VDGIRTTVVKIDEDLVLELERMQLLVDGEHHIPSDTTLCEKPDNR